MNKSKIILASIGGVAGVAVLALAYFIWSALSGKSEISDELSAFQNAAERYSRQPVYPGADSIKAVEANREKLVEWKDEAMKLASRGDLVFDPTTPPALKDLMLADAKRFSSLPGSAEGKLVKADFAFGFKDYITGGALPGEKDVPLLQRRWNDIVQVLDMLVAAGATEIVDITVKPKEVEKPKVDDRRRRGRAPAKKTEPKVKEPSKETYVFTFLARSEAIVKALNALAVCQRFMVVDSLSFARDTDALAMALGDGKKSEQTAFRRGRRGRRGFAAAEEEEKKEEENPIVTDPLMDPPYKVTASVSTYEFHSLEEEVKE
jgi:hypothetical protein